MGLKIHSVGPKHARGIGKLSELQHTTREGELVDKLECSSTTATNQCEQASVRQCQRRSAIVHKHK